MVRIRVQGGSFSVHEGSRQWEADVLDQSTLTSHSTVVKDPFTTEDEVELRWYLEKYSTESPFEVDRARKVESRIRSYGQTLWATLGIDVERIEQRAPESRLRLEIISPPGLAKEPASNFQSLHWELLELPESCNSSVQIDIIRVPARKVPENVSWNGESPPQTRQVRANNPIEAFRILLVISRNPEVSSATSKEIDPSKVLETLLEMRQLLREKGARIDIRVEVVRPGTVNALSAHLEEVKRKKGLGYFDLIHFDLHGVIKKRHGTPTAFLTFVHPTETDAVELVPAADVGKLLREHRIPIAVLNACQSARADKGGESNIAETLIAVGVGSVVAMSFNFLISAAQIFLTAFYHGLLIKGLGVADATNLGRISLKAQPSRPARYGYLVNLLDWCIPVCYTQDQAQSRQLPQLKTLDHDMATQSETKLAGRGLHKLSFEEALIKSRILYLYGPSQSGKSAFLQDLCEEWVATEFVDICLTLDLGDKFENLTQNLTVTIAGLQSQVRAEDVLKRGLSLSDEHIAQTVHHKHFALILDSLDFPFNESIVAMLEEKDSPKLLRDRDEFCVLLRKLMTAIEGASARCFLILIGLREVSWMKSILPGVNLAAFQLPPLRMHSAISLAELLLPPRLRAGLCQSRHESEALVHIVNMLQKLPGALRWVLPRASDYDSLASFHRGLFAGSVAITSTDVQKVARSVPGNTADRFLLMMSSCANIDAVARAVIAALGEFWEDGPLKVTQYLQNLEERKVIEIVPGKEKMPYTIVFLLYDLGCFDLLQQERIVDMHPLFTLVARGMQGSESIWQKGKTKLAQTLQRPWNSVLSASLNLLAATDGHSSNLATRLFLKEVENSYAAQMILNQLCNSGIDDHARFHRRAFVNMLRCIALCSNTQHSLAIPDWPLTGISSYTAPSRLLLTTSEQELFASGCESLIRLITDQPEFPTLNRSIVVEVLTITTHLASFYGPHQPRKKYKPEFTDLGLAIIMATEAQHGPMQHPELMYKSLTYRYKAIDELIAEHEVDADWWWSEMLSMQEQLDLAFADPPAIRKLERDPNFLEMDPVLQSRQKEFLRDVNRATQSWANFRTPRFWSELKAVLRNRKSRGYADFSEELWKDSKKNMQAVYQVHDEIGIGDDMRRFEEVFPTGFDVEAYSKRFSQDPRVAGAHLEQSIALGDWSDARQGHEAMFNQALQGGQFNKAQQHLKEAFRLVQQSGEADPDADTRHDVMTSLLEEVASMPRDSLGDIPVDSFVQLLQHLAESAAVLDTTVPGFSEVSLRAADLIKRAGDGYGTDEEAEECEKIFELLSAHLPPHIPRFSDYWREYFKRNREARLLRQRFNEQLAATRLLKFFQRMRADMRDDSAGDSSNTENEQLQDHGREESLVVGAAAKAGGEGLDQQSADTAPQKL